MIRNRTLQAREKLVSKLPVTGELLRGSLLDRIIRHTKGCPKCARGEGHRVFVVRNGQKWRTGCEGRISVVKRRHGLNRCR